MKKVLSVILALALTFSTVPMISSAEESAIFFRWISILSHCATPIKTPSKIKSAFTFFAAGIVAVFSGLLVYKIVKDRYLDDEKEATLVGTIFSYDITPYDGEYYIDRVLNNFINKLFSEDFPKLSRENEFPATYLAALESELKILSLRFNGEELSYKYKEFGRELLSMS